MPIPRYSTENYRDALLNLLPLGPIWNRARDGAFSALFTVLGSVYQRNNRQAADLVSDVFPGTANNFLDEWEKTLGLPDTCTGISPTVDQRRAAIIAKLTDQGGSSRAYYVGLAAAIGVKISIREYAPFRAGINRAGDPVNSESWAFAWQVKSFGGTPVWFRAGKNRAGEPLAVWGNKSLRCVIRTRSPAHTVPIFAYGLSEEIVRQTDFGGDIQ